MTITIITNATTTYRAIKASISNMSNIIKSVANIQLTRHIRSAIAAILITYDKHPLIIVCFYCHYKYNNRSLKKLLFVYVNNLPSKKFIQTIFLSPFVRKSWYIHKTVSSSKIPLSDKREMYI